MRKLLYLFFGILILIIMIPMVKSIVTTESLQYCNTFDNWNGSSYLPQIGSQDINGSISDFTLHTGYKGLMTNYFGGGAISSLNYSSVRNSSDWNLTKDYTFSFDYVIFSVTSITPRLIDTTNTTSNCGFYVDSSSNAGFIYQTFNTSGSAIIRYGGTGQRPLDSIWHNIFITYNSTDGNHTFYVDRLQRNSSNRIMDCTPSHGRDLYFGHYRNGVPGLFNGYIDNFMYWNRTFTPYEINNSVNDSICITPSAPTICPTISSCTSNPFGINIFSDTGSTIDPTQEDTLLSYNGNSMLGKGKNKCQNQ